MPAVKNTNNARNVYTIVAKQTCFRAYMEEQRTRHGDSEVIAQLEIGGLLTLLDE